MADKLAATFGPDTDEYALIREINAHLPFAEPIMPGFEWSATGKYYVRHIGHWLTSVKRRRLLNRISKKYQYEDDF